MPSGRAQTVPATTCSGRSSSHSSGGATSASVVAVERMFNGIPLQSGGDGERVPMIGANGDGLELSNKSLELRSTEAIERTARNLKSVGKILVVSVVALVLFTASISTITGIFLHRLSSTLDEVSDTLSPSALSAAVTKVQGTLDNGLVASANARHFSEDVTSMGESLTASLNLTAALIERGNEVAMKLLDHPTVVMSLGSGAR